MNRKIILLALIGIVGSILFFNFVRKTKTTAFLEARNESCEELEKGINKIFENQTLREKYQLPSPGNLSVKSCNCYYTQDIPDKEIEKKSTNYCTCTCKTNEENITVNVRRSP